MILLTILLVTKLEIAYGHHVSKLRRVKKKVKRNEGRTIFPGLSPNPIPLAH